MYAQVEYDSKFRLYLQTKLANPHYKPEIAAQTTLVNFCVTEKVGVRWPEQAYTVDVRPLYPSSMVLCFEKLPSPCCKMVRHQHTSRAVAVLADTWLASFTAICLPALLSSLMGAGS